MQKRYYHRSALTIKILTIIGLIVSAPFILVVGLGLIAFAPLLLFFFSNRNFTKAIKNNNVLSTKAYRIYVTTALFSGAGSAFGFFMFWNLSHGIDVEETPFAPFIVMAVVGCPLITAWIISVVRSWQRSNK